jgi:hypothetical protein
LQEYAEHLIFERLGRGGGAIVAVLKQLMRLPWPEAEKYVLPAMLSVASVRAAHVPLIASLAAGLAQVVVRGCERGGCGGARNPL